MRSSGPTREGSLTEMNRRIEPKLMKTDDVKTGPRANRNKRKKWHPKDGQTLVQGDRQRWKKLDDSSPNSHRGTKRQIKIDGRGLTSERAVRSKPMEIYRQPNRGAGMN